MLVFMLNQAKKKKKRPKNWKVGEESIEADEIQVGEENDAKLLSANKIQSHNAKAIATPNRF